MTGHPSSGREHPSRHRLQVRLMQRRAFGIVLLCCQTSCERTEVGSHKRGKQEAGDLGYVPLRGGRVVTSGGQKGEAAWSARLA